MIRHLVVFVLVLCSAVFSGTALADTITIHTDDVAMSVALDAPLYAVPVVVRPVFERPAHDPTPALPDVAVGDHTRRVAWRGTRRNC